MTDEKEFIEEISNYILEFFETMNPVPAISIHFKGLKRSGKTTYISRLISEILLNFYSKFSRNSTLYQLYYDEEQNNLSKEFIEEYDKITFELIKSIVLSIITSGLSDKEVYLKSKKELSVQFNKLILHNFNKPNIFLIIYNFDELQKNIIELLSYLNTINTSLTNKKLIKICSIMLELFYFNNILIRLESYYKFNCNLKSKLKIRKLEKIYGDILNLFNALLTNIKEGKNITKLEEYNSSCTINIKELFNRNYRKKEIREYILQPETFVLCIEEKIYEFINELNQIIIDNNLFGIVWLLDIGHLLSSELENDEFDFMIEIINEFLVNLYLKQKYFKNMIFIFEYSTDLVKEMNPIFNKLEDDITNATNHFKIDTILLLRKIQYMIIFSLIVSDIIIKKDLNLININELEFFTKIINNFNKYLSDVYNSNPINKNLKYDESLSLEINIISFIKEIICKICGIDCIVDFYEGSTSFKYKNMNFVLNYFNSTQNFNYLFSYLYILEDILLFKSIYRVLIENQDIVFYDWCIDKSFLENIKSKVKKNYFKLFLHFYFFQSYYFTQFVFYLYILENYDLSKNNNNEKLIRYILNIFGRYPESFLVFLLTSFYHYKHDIRLGVYYSFIKYFEKLMNILDKLPKEIKSVELGSNYIHFEMNFSYNFTKYFRYDIIFKHKKGSYVLPVEFFIFFCQLKDFTELPSTTPSYFNIKLYYGLLHSLIENVIIYLKDSYKLKIDLSEKEKEEIIKFLDKFLVILNKEGLNIRVKASILLLLTIVWYLENLVNSINKKDIFNPKLDSKHLEKISIVDNFLFLNGEFVVWSKEEIDEFIDKFIDIIIKDEEKILDEVNNLVSEYKKRKKIEKYCILDVIKDLVFRIFSNDKDSSS